MNRELPVVQGGFRKGRGTRDQIANIHWIMEKAKEFQKNIYFCFIDYVAILVDGNKRRCRRTLLEQMEKHWANTLKISVGEVHAKKLVYPCNHDQDGNPRPNGYMLERNAIDFNDR